MTSKKHSDSPRARADGLVVHWRELDEKAKALHAENQEWAKAHPLPSGTFDGGRVAIVSDTAVQFLGRDADVIEAEGRARGAEHEAALALDAAELAEGDEAARARDLTILRADLVEHEAEVARAQAALETAKRRAVERVQAASAAERAVAKRREAEGLPWLPSPLAPVPGKSFLQCVDNAIARGTKAPNYEQQVARLQNERTRVAAILEERHREEERKQKERAELQRERAEEAEQSNRRLLAQAEASRAEFQVEQAKREKLAADYLARSGS